MGRKVKPEFMNFLMCLVAMGTTSDRMSLLNPMNRILIERGVAYLSETKMEGIKALRDLSFPKDCPILPRDISRTIIPKLNAPGRIGDRELGIPDSNLAVQLLLIGSGDQNAKWATQLKQRWQSMLDKKAEIQNKQQNVAEDASLLDDVNEKRKFITSKVEDEIEGLIKKQVNPEQDRVIIVHGENWNPGIIGIDTDRLKDRFLRPAIILTTFADTPYVRGSVRSIPNIDMYSILDTVSERFFEETGKHLFQAEVETIDGKQMINAFGGHAQACGFTIHHTNIDWFKKAVHQHMNKLEETKFEFSYEVIDIIQFSQLNKKFINTLNKLSPFGQYFDYPVFYLRNCNIIKARAFGNKYQEFRTPHVNFVVKEVNDKKKKSELLSLPAVGYSLFEKYHQLKKQSKQGVFDIVFTIDFNKRRMKKDKQFPVELTVLDIRETSKRNLDYVYD